MNKYTANVLFKLNISCHCENIFFLLLMKTKEKHKQQWKLLIPLLQFLNVEEFCLCYDDSSSQFNKFQPIYNKSYFSQFIVMCNLRSKRLRAVSDQRTGNES